MRFLCSSHLYMGQNTSATKFNLFTLAFQKLTAVNTETKKRGEKLILMLILIAR